MKRRIDPATLPVGMGVPEIAALLAATSAGYVPPREQGKPSAPSPMHDHRVKMWQVDRLATNRRVVPTPFAKAKSCKARYPTSKIRQLGNGTVEVYEPSTGFVYGRGHGARAAVRAAMRRRK